MKYYGLQSAKNLHQTIQALKSWRNEILSADSKKEPERGLLSNGTRSIFIALRFLAVYQQMIPFEFRIKIQRILFPILNNSLLTDSVSPSDLYIAGLRAEVQLLKQAKRKQYLRIASVLLIIITVLILFSLKLSGKI